MRFTSRMDDISILTDEIMAHGDRAATDTMDQVTTGLKTDLRDQVEAAGLGSRLAFTWQGRRYPTGKPSLDAAAYVWSKAPKLIDVYNRGATIRAVGGHRYLMLPTENVPMRRGARGSSRRMTPEEVETAFNQDLKFFRSPKGQIIAYVEVIAARSGRGFRRATPGRIKQGRAVESIFMFFAVPAVRVNKRIDIETVANKWAGRVPDLLVRNWK